jgi:hypothetical protein
MKRTLLVTLLAVGAAATLAPPAARAEAQRQGRAELIAWAADASAVVFAEPRPNVRRRLDLVARRVPGGEVIARSEVFPGECARVIDHRVAISHACAFAQLRPRLPARYRDVQFHIAATERGRITTLTLRADGSTVEHQIPALGLVLRGHTETPDEDEAIAVLEVARLGREDSTARVLDRRPVRPRSRRRWTLLQAGDRHFIVVGRGVLRRIGGNPPPAPPTAPPQPPQPDLAGARPSNG